MRSALLAILLLPWALQATLWAAGSPPSMEGGSPLGFCLAEPLQFPLDGVADPERLIDAPRTPVEPGNGSLSGQFLTGTPPRLRTPGSFTTPVGSGLGPQVAAGHSTPGEARAPPVTSLP